MRKVLCFIKPRAKAVAGLVVAGVTDFATRKGLHLPPGWEVGVTGLITSAAVYFIPNTYCASTLPYSGVV